MVLYLLHDDNSKAGLWLLYLQTAINLAAVCKCARDDQNTDLTLPSPRPAADCAPRPRPRPGPCEGLPAAPAQTQTQD